MERKLEGGGINNDDDGEEKTLRAGDEAQQQARERACKDKRGAMAGFTNVFSVVSEGKISTSGEEIGVLTESTSDCARRCECCVTQLSHSQLVLQFTAVTIVRVSVVCVVLT